MAGRGLATRVRQPVRPMNAGGARIPEAHYVNADYSENRVHTWVITPDPLDAAMIARFDLEWGWSPIPYETQTESAFSG